MGKTHKYIATFGDHASGGMDNREEIVEATSAPAAYQVAKLRMLDGEFLRGVRPADEKEG